MFKGIEVSLQVSKYNYAYRSMFATTEVRFRDCVEPSTFSTGIFHGKRSMFKGTEVSLQVPKYNYAYRSISATIEV